jgi:hypothetical protein
VGSIGYDNVKYEFPLEFNIRLIVVPGSIPSPEIKVPFFKLLFNGRIVIELVALFIIFPIEGPIHDVSNPSSVIQFSV